MICQQKTIILLQFFQNFLPQYVRMSVIVKTTCSNDPTYHFFHGFFYESRKNFKNPLTNTRGCGIILYVRYVRCEMNTCDAGVAQWQSSWFVISRLMVRLRSPAPYGSVPEWPKGTDCKSAAFSFGGPNPPAPTTRVSPGPIHAHFIMRVSFFAARVRVSYVDSLCARFGGDIVLRCAIGADRISFCGVPSRRATNGRPYSDTLLFVLPPTKSHSN